MKLIHDPSTHRLGRLRRTPDPRDLKLAHYLRPELLPPIPTNRDWGSKIGAGSWGMLGNDQYGDCTCAAVGHAVMAWTANTSKIFIPTTQQVLSLYTTVTGEEGAAFDPTTGQNDNGCVIADVLKEWRTNGFVGHQLGAYAYVKPRRFDLVRAAIDLFGVVDIGIDLPIDAQTQDVWSVSDMSLQGNAAPGSWGGHSITLTGFSPHVAIGETWGQKKYMTWAWLYYYCTEVWALLSPDWVNGTQKAPSGFYQSQLQEDLAELTS